MTHTHPDSVVDGFLKVQGCRHQVAPHDSLELSGALYSQISLSRISVCWVPVAPQDIKRINSVRIEHLLYDFLRGLARPVDVSQHTLDQVKVHTSSDGHPQIFQRPEVQAALSPRSVHASHCRGTHPQLSKLKKTVAEMTTAVKQMANSPQCKAGGRVGQVAGTAKEMWPQACLRRALRE